MRIDPLRLIRLAVLVRHGGFRRAAEHLGLTQPALSQSIAQIEKEVGVKLIERTPHGIKPTIYGQVLCEHAKAVDREITQAEQHIRELVSGHRGSLAVGVTGGAAASLVAMTVCRMLEGAPGTGTRVVEETTVKPLLAALHNRVLDMLVCQRPLEFELQGTRSFSLFRARRLACVRSDHPLPDPISIEGLTGFPFVCPQDEVGTLLGFRQIFHAAGLEVPDLLVSNSIHVAKEIVLNSDAFGLFSDLSVLGERRLGLLRAAELEPGTRYWMQLIVRDDFSPGDLARLFVREIGQVCGTLGLEAHADLDRFRRLRSLPRA